MTSTTLALARSINHVVTHGQLPAGTSPDDPRFGAAVMECLAGNYGIILVEAKEMSLLREAAAKKAVDGAMSNEMEFGVVIHQQLEQFMAAGFDRKEAMTMCEVLLDRMAEAQLRHFGE